MSFKEIPATEMTGNFMQDVSKKWMLIGAEHMGKVNMMTASWGGIGHMWGKNLAMCVILPQRFTHPMVDNEDNFSLCFFSEQYREQLNICGSKSGRDCDKPALCGFDVLYEGTTPYFAQAETVIICRKVAKLPFTEESFIDKSIVESCYPKADFHDMFIGEITKVLVKE